EGHHMGREDAVGGLTDGEQHATRGDCRAAPDVGDGNRLQVDAEALGQPLARCAVDAVGGHDEVRRGDVVEADLLAVAHSDPSPFGQLCQPGEGCRPADAEATLVFDRDLLAVALHCPAAKGVAYVAQYVPSVSVDRLQPKQRVIVDGHAEAIRAPRRLALVDSHLATPAPAEQAGCQQAARTATDDCDLAQPHAPNICVRWGEVNETVSFSTKRPKLA